MGTDPQHPISAEHLEHFLKRCGYPDATVLQISPLGQSIQEGLKDYGYGKPLRVTFSAAGAEHDVVIRTMSPDPFGHDRRADRADVIFQAYDTFNTLPRHIRALGIGAFDSEYEMHMIPHGEAFLVTNYVEGELYAHDLNRLSRAADLERIDLERATALARYLARLHREKVDPALYVRELRDTVGSGEGIFGLCDSYPAGHPIATAERLQAIEQAAMRWRWRLKRFRHRASTTHGDFHPFNILFREQIDFTVLDRSRGGVGEPADDVCCLSINYLFFALQQRQRFDGPLRRLWDRFWQVYLEESNDPEIQAVVAPFFAWRALVLASPLWYPHIGDELRDRLLRFVERLLEGSPFDPERVDEVLK